MCMNDWASAQCIHGGQEGRGCNGGIACRASDSAVREGLAFLSIREHTTALFPSPTTAFLLSREKLPK